MIQIDQELCTGCSRCRELCPTQAIQGSAGQPHSIDQERCILCGQCVQICSAYDSPEMTGKKRSERIAERKMLPETHEPIFAAHYRGHILEFVQQLNHGNSKVIVQCAPAVRVALGEEFGLEYGALSPGKLAASLRALGVYRVYDTNFAADLTIMEEGAELIERLSNEEQLPMFTSCCPGWVRYVRQLRPELAPQLSSCKSPQQMAGALFKSYGASKDKVDPKTIYSVAVMPCTCKAYESQLAEMEHDGLRDVDLVITTRELAQLLKARKISYHDLLDEKFDSPLGCYSGAGTIFGATGGVMEAALRSACEQLTGKALPEVELKYVRGGEGIRYATLEHEEVKLEIAVVAGLAHIQTLLDDIANKRHTPHFVEVMCCPQGCVSGGGQPKVLLPEQMQQAQQARKAALYSHDRDLAIRKSHKNPEIINLYRDFLGQPLGEKSHTLLHYHGGEHA